MIDVAGEGADAGRRAPRRTSSSARCGPRSTCSVASPAGSSCRARTGSRTAAASARRPPRSSPASCWRARSSSAATRRCRCRACSNLASRLEGHPDNVAACLLGGLTIAWTRRRIRRRCTRSGVNLDPDASARIVFVPPTASSTKASRKSLPATVPHGDAAFNAARAALLIADADRHRSEAPMTTRVDDEPDDVGRSADVLLAATDDRLHQQYRRTGMTATANLVAALRASGIAAVMSGAGPSVLAFTRTEAEVKAADCGRAQGLVGIAAGRRPGRRPSGPGPALSRRPGRYGAPRGCVERVAARPCCRRSRDATTLTVSVRDASDNRRPLFGSASLADHRVSGQILTRVNQMSRGAARPRASCGQRTDSLESFRCSTARSQDRDQRRPSAAEPETGSASGRSDQSSALPTGAQTPSKGQDITVTDTQESTLDSGAVDAVDARQLRPGRRQTAQRLPFDHAAARAAAAGRQPRHRAEQAPKSDLVAAIQSAQTSGERSCIGCERRQCTAPQPASAPQPPRRRPIGGRRRDAGSAGPLADRRASQPRR